MVEADSRLPVVPVLSKTITRRRMMQGSVAAAALTSIGLHERAFAQDAAALKLSMDGLANGHYRALGAPWRRIAHTQLLGHCEGSDHLERLDLLISRREDIATSAPTDLQPVYRSLVKQARDVHEVIAVFGRHPHRNQVLGRPSTPAELAYVAKGEFPHLRAFQG